MTDHEKAIQEVREKMRLQPFEVPRGYIVDVTERAIRAERKLDEAVRLLHQIHEELDNRYDGADDSRTRWMGNPLDKVSAFLAAHKGESNAPTG